MTDCRNQAGKDPFLLSSQLPQAGSRPSFHLPVATLHRLEMHTAPFSFPGFVGGFLIRTFSGRCWGAGGGGFWLQAFQENGGAGTPGATPAHPNSRLWACACMCVRARTRTRIAHTHTHRAHTDTKPAGTLPHSHSQATKDRRHGVRGICRASF